MNQTLENINKKKNEFGSNFGKFNPNFGPKNSLESFSSTSS